MPDRRVRMVPEAGARTTCARLRPGSTQGLWGKLDGVIGSPGIAAWIAHAVFWGLLLYGWTRGHLSLKRIATFLLLWLAGRVGLPYVPYTPAAAMFSSFVAVLDIALVFMIFKGDVRLT